MIICVGARTCDAKKVESKLDWAGCWFQAAEAERKEAPLLRRAGKKIQVSF